MYLVHEIILHACNNVEISEHFNIQLKFVTFVSVPLSSNYSEFNMLQKNKAFIFSSILISKMKSKIRKDKANCHILQGKNNYTVDTLN